MPFRERKAAPVGGILALCMLLAPTGVVAAEGVSWRLYSAQAPEQPGSIPPNDVEWQAARGAARAVPALWLRIEVEALPAEPMLLAVPRRFTVTATLYAPPDYRPRRSHFYHGPFHSAYSSRHHVFELDHQELLSGPLYLHVATPTGVAVAPQVVTRDEFRAADMAHFGFKMSVRTVLGLMAVVNLFFWLILRIRTYLWYVGYVVSLLGYFSALDGSLFSVSWFSFLAPLGIRVAWAMAICAVVCVLNFARDFAEFTRFTPNLSRVLLWGQWALLVLLVPLLSGIEWLQEPARVLLNLLVLVMSPVLLGAGVLSAWRGSRYARFFLVGWTPITLATGAAVLAALNVLPDPEKVYAVYGATAAFEALVFALGLADRTLQFRQERDVARMMAERDHLTRVLNRRALNERLHALATATVQRGASDLSVLFIDVDRFKRVNDRFGHEAGDQCLQALTRAMQLELRHEDLLARYGGEEFVIVLPRTDREDALSIGERIRKRLAAAPLRVGSYQIPVTVSIGVASLASTVQDPEALLREADRALYQSKARGRNRVSIAE